MDNWLGLTPFLAEGCFFIIPCHFFILFLSFYPKPVLVQNMIEQKQKIINRKK